MTLRVGIISANWGTFAHLPAWRAIDGVEVTAVCTSRRETAEAAAARHGLPRAFWDAHALCADPDIDIVDCGTRPVIREAHVLAALANRKHVYNAIPFARDFAGARAIHEAWIAAGTVGVTDAFSEWIPALRLAREMIDQGFVGRPLAGSCTFDMGLFHPLRAGFPYNWFAEGGQGVSAVRNLGSQALTMLVHLLGDIDELVADDRRTRDAWTTADGAETLPVATNDLATAMLRFANGAIVQLRAGWTTPAGPGWRLEVSGTEGRIVTEAPSFPTARDTVLLAARAGEETVRPVAIPERLRRVAGVALDAEAAIQPSYPMALSMRAMVGAITGTGTERPSPDFARAWHVERVQEAIRRSSEARAWVALDTVR